MISSSRKHFLVDPENNVRYLLNFVGNKDYFAKETRELRTVEKGSWYHLDGRYILCSEDMISYVYK